MVSLIFICCRWTISHYKLVPPPPPTTNFWGNTRHPPQFVLAEVIGMQSCIPPVSLLLQHATHVVHLFCSSCRHVYTCAHAHAYKLNLLVSHCSVFFKILRRQDNAKANVPPSAVSPSSPKPTTWLEGPALGLCYPAMTFHCNLNEYSTHSI